MYRSITVKNQLKTIALLGGLSVLLVLLGRAISPAAMWLFGALAIGMNLLSYFFSDRIVLAMSRAHPVDRRPDPGLFAMVAPIAPTILQLAISRSREYLADAEGARLAGDPLALASALAKLERGNRRIPMHTVADSPATSSLFICAPLSTSQVASGFSTHPPIAERIRRLETLAAGTRSRAARLAAAAW
jgi:Zn-dependent protease with chaperone function